MLAHSTCTHSVLLDNPKLVSKSCTPSVGCFYLCMHLSSLHECVCAVCGGCMYQGVHVDIRVEVHTMVCIKIRGLVYGIMPLPPPLCRFWGHNTGLLACPAGTFRHLHPLSPPAGLAVHSKWTKSMLRFGVACICQSGISLGF